MTFTVIDKKTGKPADGPALVNEPWASELACTNIDGFAVLNHGSLALIGQSGQYLPTPVGRFEVAWETDEEGPFIWEVIVRVGLAEGATKEDAELESVTLGEHQFEIEAHCGPDAEEMALDQFHRSFTIGNLDAVMIATVAARKP